MSESAPETEVSDKATRRRFTAEYKRRVLLEAGRCHKRGELGALLRREGLYSSHLTSWRLALDESDLAALAPKKRGPAAKVVDARDAKLVEQEREIATLKRRLERAEAIIELQKKLSDLLGIQLPESNGSR